MNASCSIAIPPGGRLAAVLGAGQQPVTALPGLTGPAEQTEGKVTTEGALCSVGVQAGADLRSLKRGLTPPAAAAAVPEYKQGNSGVAQTCGKEAAEITSRGCSFVLLACVSLLCHSYMQSAVPCCKATPVIHARHVVFTSNMC